MIFIRSKGSTISKLRNHFGGEWAFDISSRSWKNITEGWFVYRCAALAPSYPDDDDTFRIEFYRSDTGERIIGLNGDGNRC